MPGNDRQEAARYDRSFLQMAATDENRMVSDGTVADSHHLDRGNRLDLGSQFFNPGDLLLDRLLLRGFIVR